jgi:hypothetical protein
VHCVTIVANRLDLIELSLYNNLNITIMKHNMGTADRLIRLIVAAIIVFLYSNHTIEGTSGIVLLVIAIVFALTSFISFCPLYTLFGLSSKKK